MRRLSATLLALGLSGCASYQLGSTLPPGIDSVHIPIFVNATNEPGVDEITTQAAIEEFQNDGSLRVTSAADADLILEVRVHHYELKPVRYRRDRATQPDEFRLKLTAEVIARKTSDNSVLVHRNHVQGESTFPVTEDIRTAKIEALPEAAKDLAHDIVEAVVEFW